MNIASHNTNNSINISDLTIIALFTAVMAVCSWISVPATVPFTLQTFGVFLTCGLLGGKRGTITVIIYLLLGAIGIPVFSGFTGGIGHLLGPTGGYIIGFLFSALVMWASENIAGKTAASPQKALVNGSGVMYQSAPARRSEIVLAASMVLGLIVCYAFGTAWFMTVYTRSTGSIGLMTALGWCVFPYVIPDAAKIALAMVLCRRLKPVLAGLSM